MSKKIYVGNMPFKYRDNDLKSIFEKFGEVEEAAVIMDRYNEGRSKGFGFVTFVNDEDADKAVTEMNGKDSDGRELVVNEAKPREDEVKEFSTEETEEATPVEEPSEAVVEKLDDVAEEKVEETPAEEAKEETEPEEKTE
ncbi:hypothetical protein HOD29_05240 [archaeon]|jgi:cold-inducible RNA-binding protein|nr:hypothetical protein [archaeon]